MKFSMIYYDKFNIKVDFVICSVTKHGVMGTQDYSLYQKMLASSLAILKQVKHLVRVKFTVPSGVSDSIGACTCTETRRYCL